VTESRFETRRFGWFWLVQVAAAAETGLLFAAGVYLRDAEALTLATKLGVDTQQLLSLIEATMVRSGVVDYKGPFVLQRDFTPNFSVRLMAHFG